MHVLSVGSEAVPFVKTGGLGDVCGALPDPLAKRGHRVTTVLPLYRGIDRTRHGITDTGKAVRIHMGGKTVTGTIWHSRATGHDTYLIGCPAYWDRPELYGDAAGDYPDNAERFSFFARAALSLCLELGLLPDVIHNHDWQAALVPVYLREQPGVYGALAGTGTVQTIHNLAYQGRFDNAAREALDLPDRALTMAGLEFYGQLNFLKGGLMYADAITTVSPTYAKEIQHEETGCGLDGVLRHRHDALTGIVNGIDTALWDPEHDSQLIARFSLAHPEARKANREALIKEFGLSSGTGPVIGMVGRLVEQKGASLLLESLEALVRMEVRLAILGSGDPHLEQDFVQAARKYPGYVGLVIGFDGALSRRIYAGCDLFLMPSRFEPCGLSQLIAMRYGAPPIVHRVGGLADTVHPYHPPHARDATGFAFNRFSTDALLACVGQALSAFGKAKVFERIRKNGMARDSSWAQSAAAYEEVYHKTRKVADMRLRERLHPDA